MPAVASSDSYAGKVSTSAAFRTTTALRGAHSVAAKASDDARPARPAATSTSRSAQDPPRERTSSATRPPTDEATSAAARSAKPVESSGTTPDGDGRTWDRTMARRRVGVACRPALAGVRSNFGLAIRAHRDAVASASPGRALGQQPLVATVSLGFSGQLRLAPAVQPSLQASVRRRHAGRARGFDRRLGELPSGGPLPLRPAEPPYRFLRRRPTATASIGLSWLSNARLTSSS